MLHQLPKKKVKVKIPYSRNKHGPIMGLKREHSANACYFYSAAVKSNNGRSNHFSCFYSLKRTSVQYRYL